MSSSSSSSSPPSRGGGNGSSAFAQRFIGFTIRHIWSKNPCSQIGEKILLFFNKWCVFNSLKSFFMMGGGEVQCDDMCNVVMCGVVWYLPCH